MARTKKSRPLAKALRDRSQRRVALADPPLVRPAPGEFQSSHENTGGTGFGFSGFSRPAGVAPEIWETFTRGNPLKFLAGPVAGQSRTSAHGLSYVEAPQVWDLLDEMCDKEIPIAGALRMLEAMVLRRGWTVRDHPDDKDGTIRAAIERDVLGYDGPFDFDQAIRTFVCGRVRHGLAISEIVWEGDAAAGTFGPMAVIHRHPGMFVFDELANLYLLNGGILNAQRARPNKYIVSRAPALYGNPYSESLIWPLRWLHMIKKESLKDWAAFLANYGTPLIIARPGNGQGPVSEKVSTLQTILENLTSSSGIIFADGEEFESFARSGSQASVHDKLIEYLDRAMVRLILGAELGTMEAEHASRASSQVAAGMQEIHSKPLAEETGKTFTRDLLKPYVRFNFGPNAPVPELKIDTDDAMDTAAAIEILRFSCKELGLDVSEAQAREWLGLDTPLEESDVIEIVTPEPPPGGTGDTEENITAEGGRTSTAAGRGAPSNGRGVDEARQFAEAEANGKKKAPDTVSAP